MPHAFRRSRTWAGRGRLEPSDDLAFLRETDFLERESPEVMISPSMPVISAMLVIFRVPSLKCLLNDDLDGRRDLLPHRALRQIRGAHGDHRLDARRARGMFA